MDTSLLARLVSKLDNLELADLLEDKTLTRDERKVVREEAFRRSPNNKHFRLAAAYRAAAREILGY